MIRKYMDDAVSFEYDDEQFESRNNGQLRYIGKETDGSRIRVPNGIVDGTAMFEDTGIQSAPTLPDSIKIMSNMYRGCADMKDPGQIPEGVTDIDGAYSYTGIRETPHIPDSVESANFAFDHCRNLEHCENFSNNMKNAVCMFAGDKSLTTLPEELPDSLIDMDGFACGCENLAKAPKTGCNVKNMSHAYASNTRLENMPEIPEGAYTKDVISDCYTLEQKGINDGSLSAAFQAANDFSKDVKTPEKPLDRDAALTEITDNIENGSSAEHQMEE